MAQSPLAVRNRLLLALSPDALAALLPRMQPVSLPLRQILARPGRPFEAIYFIEGGWVSMVAGTEEGGSAEVGLIGREGMFGASLIGGVDTCFVDTYVQANATASRMDAGIFRREVESHPELRALLFRYNEAMHAQSMQTAACNGRHVVQQRFAKWLLMGHDRVDGDELPLTQDFLALMLCVRRSTVSETARPLQKAGAIRYSRGHITVLDRGRLEQTACDCYNVIRNRFNELVG